MTTPVEALPAPPPEEIWLARRMLAVRRVAAGGEPAVFVHGLNGSSLNWTDFGYTLSGRLDSWAVDLPGFGLSPPPRDGDYSTQGHALAVLDLIVDRIGEPVHLFGNSLGGAVSLQLAARAPMWVRSLTLVSPALPGVRVTKANISLPVLSVPGVGEHLVRRSLRLPADARARAQVQTWYADVGRMHPARLAEAVAEVERRDALTYPVDAFAQSARGLLRTMFERGPNRPLALAARVTCPVLLVYGSLDQLADPAEVGRVAAKFGHARVVVLPDSGHVAQMEHPELLAEAWRSLVARVAEPHER